MPHRQDDKVAWRSRGEAGRNPAVRVLTFAGGLPVAVVAAAGSFLTDDARYLRLAVLAAAWAFVAAVLFVGRLRSEQHAAARREQELRRAYERELDDEAAARREFELGLESDLSRKAEEAMRGDLAMLRHDLAELARMRDELGQLRDVHAGLASLADVRIDLAGLSALRADVAALTELRADVAALTELRADVAALTELRADVAALAGLRGDVAAVAALRNDLDQLGELRADLGRLRTELAEQLGGEMLVERIVMRAQAGRVPAERGELPAALPPSLEPSEPGPPPVPGWVRSRHAAADPSLAAPSPFALERTGPLTVEAIAERPRPVPYRRRRTDETGPQGLVDAAEAVTTERRVVAPVRPAPAEAPSRPAAPDGPVRVSDLLAENGIGPSGGSRRRRRYREDGETDDVLARVLGRS